MANYSIYLESLQALSNALISAMSLMDARQEILRLYSSMPSAPIDGNQTAYLDAIFDVLPRIEKLRSDERMYRNEYSEQINKSFQSALNYILSCEDVDISAGATAAFLQHLNLLSDIIRERKAKGEDALSYDNDLYSRVLKKLDSVPAREQAKALKQSLQRIIETYVG